MRENDNNPYGIKIPMALNTAPRNTKSYEPKNPSELGLETCKLCGLQECATNDDGECCLCWQKRKDAGGWRERRETEAIVKLVETNIGSKGSKEFTFENFKKEIENMDAFNAAKNFSPGDENIFIYGTCGTGKTHLAGAVFKKFSEDKTRKGVFFHELYKLAGSLRTVSWNEYERVLNTLVNADVLILDDIGLEKPTEHVLNILYWIFDGRISKEKKGLFITSNFQIKELAERMNNDPIISRLSSLCKKPILISGQDRRLIK